MTSVLTNSTSPLTENSRFSRSRSAPSTQLYSLAPLVKNLLFTVMVLRLMPHRRGIVIICKSASNFRTC
jgi:hypothetical protein